MRTVPSASSVAVCPDRPTVISPVATKRPSSCARRLDIPPLHAITKTKSIDRIIILDIKKARNQTRTKNGVAEVTGKIDPAEMSRTLCLDHVENQGGLLFEEIGKMDLDRLIV
jgi:hypothetical protein